MRMKQTFFSGERPRVASFLTKDYEAQDAENCDFSRGDLRSLKAHAREANLTATGTLLSLYQWMKTATDEWIVSTNELDFCRSPIAGEAHDRVYVTGMAEPRVLTNSILSVPFDFTTDYYKLGVPAPVAALSGATPAVPGTDYRAYIYSYVVKLNTTDAEEGKNSPILAISNYGSGNVTLAGFTAPPSGRSIGKIRIYRTSSGSAGVADFLFVGEFNTAGVDFGTYTYVDNVADSALGEVFTCETWEVPPTTLAGLIAPNGGSLVGFVGNRVYFSEPYLPHAWPYSYPVDSTIIGLGSIGNTIIVLTDAFIYMMTGPANAISTQKLSSRMPCVSKAGIVSCEIGVLYPSDEGIVQVTMDGPSLLSYEYFTKNQYSAYNPSIIRAVFYYGKYFAFHSDGCFMINVRDQSFSRLSVPDTVTTISTPHVSLVDNNLYFIGHEDTDTNARYKFEGGASDSYLQYLFRSKDVILGSISNLSSAKIIRDTSGFGTANQAINDAIFAAGVGGTLNDIAVNDGEVNYDGLQTVYSGTVFKLYGDGDLIFTKTIINNDAFRLPAGVLYQRCFYELLGDIPVDEVILASSMEELNDAA